MKLNTKYLCRIFIILLLTSLVSVFIPSIETFMDMSLSTRDRCPTRNQSYDLRGDISIKRQEMLFNNPAWGPLDPERCQNRPLL